MPSAALGSTVSDVAASKRAARNRTPIAYQPQNRRGARSAERTVRRSTTQELVEREPPRRDLVQLSILTGLDVGAPATIW